MEISRLFVVMCFISALSNPFYAWAGSADEKGDQGATTKPVSRPDPDCDHSDGQPSDGRFDLTL